MELQWIDVDFEADTLTIQHTRVVNGVVVVKDKTKLQIGNQIYLLIDETKEIFLKLKRTGAQERPLANKYTNGCYIFVNEFRQPYHTSYPSQKLYKSLKIILK